MIDPSTITTGPITDLSATYLLTCWRDSCRERVSPDDALGLCAGCREELRA